MSDQWQNTGHSLESMYYTVYNNFQLEQLQYAVQIVDKFLFVKYSV